MLCEKKYLSNHFQLEQIWLNQNSNKNVAKVNKIYVINVKFCSKNVLFSNVYPFLSKKIATFKKSYEIGINKLFFSCEEKYSLKKQKYVWP